jgi:hypothetical protein
MSEKVKSSYCCGALDYQLRSEYCPIRYSSRFREYSIQDFESTSISIMLFCSNCGTEFPSSLRDKWWDILEKEYGLEDPFDDDQDKVPQEFLTDEWWKNRGLEEHKPKSAYADLLGNRPIQCLSWQ